MDAERLIRAGALAVDPVDTTGAGDSFIAGFLVAHLRGTDLRSSLMAGARQARTTCLHVGGFSQPLLALDSFPSGKFTRK